MQIEISPSYQSSWLFVRRLNCIYGLHKPANMRETSLNSSGPSLVVSGSRSRRCNNIFPSHGRYIPLPNYHGNFFNTSPDPLFQSTEYGILSNGAAVLSYYSLYIISRPRRRTPTGDQPTNGSWPRVEPPASPFLLSWPFYALSCSGASRLFTIRVLHHSLNTARVARRSTSENRASTGPRPKNTSP